MPLDVTFDVVKDGDRIVGVQLVANPQTEAEEFVSGMLWGLKHASASIRFVNGKLAFSYVDSDGSGEHVVTPQPSEVGQLEDLFGDPEAMWETKRAGHLTPGFRYIAINRARM